MITIATTLALPAVLAAAAAVAANRGERRRLRMSRAMAGRADGS